MILDRNPFGPDPIELQPEFNGNHAAQQLAESVDGNYRLCMVLEDAGGGTHAGLQPRTGKKKKGFILAEGESHLGLKLISVNVAAAEATLQQSGQNIVLKLKKPSTAQVSHAKPISSRAGPEPEQAAAAGSPQPLDAKSRRYLRSQIRQLRENESDKK